MSVNPQTVTAPKNVSVPTGANVQEPAAPKNTNQAPADQTPNLREQVLYILNQSFSSLQNVYTDLLHMKPQIPGEAYGYAEGGEKAGSFPKKLWPMRIEEVSKKKLDKTFTRITDIIFGALGSLVYGRFSPDDIVRTIPELFGQQTYKDLTAQIMEDWTQDSTFCEQYLQGVNPIMITVVKDIAKQVPEPLRGVTAQGKGLQDLVNEKRLFIVDYKDLDFVNSKGVRRYHYAPYLLLYKTTLDMQKMIMPGQLAIAGVQLLRQPEAGQSSIPIYTPLTTPPNQWLLVKMNVAMADNMIHQFKLHLGLSHYCQEPVVIATHNQLQDHDIGVLLTPHLRGTLFINYLARQILVGDILPDKEEHIHLASLAWKDYDFMEGGFAKEIEARGFDEKKTDGLNGYYYRDDGYSLWNVLGRYVTDAVNKSYPNDYEVKHDVRLQAWAEEMQDPARANIKGFPKHIHTKPLLIEVCQIIIWNGSALHSTINYSQWPYFGFGKNRPQVAPLVPTLQAGQKDVELESFLNCFQPVAHSVGQILFAWLLTQQEDDTTLNHLSATRFEDVNANLQKDLKNLTEKINTRNAVLGAQQKVPYFFCLPENVNCSVNI